MSTVDRSLPLDQQVEALVTPIASELGLVVYDVEVYPSSKRGRVRITVEREGATGPGTGVTIDEITQVSRRLGYQLEADDVIRFEYHLEVTSPGVERDLKTERHWRQNVGSQVHVVLRAPLDGDVVVDGTLVSVDTGSVSIETARGSVDVILDDVRRARTVYDFESGIGRRDGGSGKSSSKASKGRSDG